MNGCTEYGEDLSAYVDAALSVDRRREIEAHLPGCAACRALVAAERRLDAALREMPRVEPSPQFEANLWARLARAEEDETSRWQRFVSRLPGPAWAIGSAAALGLAVFLNLPDTAPTEEDWVIVTDPNFDLLLDEDLELIVSLDVLEGWDGSEV